LGSYIFGNLGVLYDSDIDIPDGIRAHYVSTGFADRCPSGTPLKSTTRVLAP
jgi:hypothetical protein